MRRTLFFFATFVFMITGCHSQNKEDQVISMLKEFYIAYNAVWEKATSYEPEDFEEKVFSLHRKYCSKKLQSEIKKYYEIYRLEHDLLTNDFGGTNAEKLESTLTIVKDAEKDNAYIVSYVVEIEAPSIPREELNVINLIVIKEGGSFKIDEVW